jgi:hypothetical protein
MADTVSEIRGIPRIIREDGSLSALETVFNFYGNSSPDMSGTVEAVAKKNGFEVEQLPNNLDLVKDQVSGGTPVLVRYRDNRDLRYGLITGWGTDSLKLDSNWMPREDFEALWDGTALTVLPDNEDFKREHKFKEIVRKV